MTGGPGRDAERVRPDGYGATSVAFSPEGGRLAVASDGRERGIAVEDLATGARHVVGRSQAGASPLLAGWSPDGRWLLFWLEPRSSASLGADGLALEAVRAGGGSPKLVAATLLYPDLLTTCGDHMVVTAGRSRYVTSGKRVIEVAAPAWSPTRISHDPSRSWFWPACTSDASRIAMTSTKNVEERRFDAAERSIWLAAPGAKPVRLVGRDGDGISDEFPRWSADGQYLLFVRHASRTQARAQLVIARVQGHAAHVLGPVAKLSPQLGYYGHDDWAAVSDWYRPN
jgi:Tol biopolymer transport system component